MLNRQIGITALFELLHTDLIRNQLKVRTGVQTNDLSIMISGQKVVLQMHVVMSKFNYINLATKLTIFPSIEEIFAVITVL